MKPAEIYRRYGAECVELAQKASTPEDRAHLLQMAQHWRQLAEKAGQPARRLNASKVLPMSPE